MQHKVKVTVLDTKLYPEYQQQYCANPCSGKCPVYNAMSIIKETNLCFIVMTFATTTGIAALTRS